MASKITTNDRAAVAEIAKKYGVPAEPLESAFEEGFNGYAEMLHSSDNPYQVDRNNLFQAKREAWQMGREEAMEDE